MDRKIYLKISVTIKITKYKYLMNYIIYIMNYYVICKVICIKWLI